MAGALGALTLFHLGCRSRGRAHPDALRIGHAPSLTHAPIITLIAQSAEVPSPSTLSSFVLRSGPRSIEALLAGAIDVAVVGPGPAVVAQARHGDHALVALGAVASGGASFIVSHHHAHRPNAEIARERLATVQLASSQDIALRRHLLSLGVPRSRQNVVALARDAIRLGLASGAIAGAWLPEPLATRLADAGIGARKIDERDLWKGGRFTAAMLVARRDVWEARRHAIDAFLLAARREIAAFRAGADRRRWQSFGDAVERATGLRDARETIARAALHVDFDTEIHRPTLIRFARDAHDAGLISRVPSETWLV